ncbi:aminopeptidase P family N-terminal domain-containing protein [Candidatus Poriferisocius sp.]|uniref:aminopeptidase P family N-terminal domain-containing protein n=1 Tax=Candidatus Poriferisocius sp. TaxID=3101276 RepID=UPI003B01A064
MSLNRHRRNRVTEALVGAGIDILVCGRQDNVNYITGAHQLWTAGTRPFGPICTLNTATGEVFLLSTWDEGIPDDIPFDHLHGITWNGSEVTRRVAATPGMATARRVGIDSWSPGMAAMLGAVAPEAEVVPADDALARARRTKLAGEIDAIRAACAVAAAGVAAATARAGTDTERLAAGVEAMALAGSSTPASEPLVRGSTVDFGCIRYHYEGGLSRTAGGDPELTTGLIRACVPGATAADLRRAAPDAGWLVRGCGMGHEPPVINSRYGTGEVLKAGMVLSVGADTGTDHRRDIVLVTESNPEILSPEAT